MDFLTFLSSVIDSAVWPITLFSILWVFRNSVGELIGVIRDATLKIKKGDTNIELQLKTVREKITTIQKTQPPKEVEQLVASSPFRAIEKSWSDLEQSASAVTSVTSNASPIQIADALIEKDILTPNEAEAFYEMYEIHQATIKPGSNIITDVSSASSYSDIAYALSDKITGTGSHQAERATSEGKGIVIPKSKKKKSDNKP